MRKIIWKALKNIGASVSVRGYGEYLRESIFCKKTFEYCIWSRNSCSNIPSLLLSQTLVCAKGKSMSGYPMHTITHIDGYEHVGSLPFPGKHIFDKCWINIEASWPCTPYAQKCVIILYTYFGTLDLIVQCFHHCKTDIWTDSPRSRFKRTKPSWLITIIEGSKGDNSDFADFSICCISL